MALPQGKPQLWNPSVPARQLKLQNKLFVPKESRKETPTGQGECGWNPRGESIKEVNPLILYMKSHKSQPDP